MNIDDGWTQRVVEVRNLKLNYYRTGKGNKPPMVLVHGFSDNGLCWLPVARELEDRFDIIMPDMRGHGLSARAAEDKNVDMAGDLAALIDELDLKHPVVGGHSMGAAVTFEFAVRFPDVPRALFFEDPPWFIDPPFGAKAGEVPEENPIAEWAKTLPGISLARLIEDYTRDNPTWPPELIQVMCESKKQLDVEIVDIITKNIFRLEPDWKEEIPKFRQPLLLISGEPEEGGFVSTRVLSKVKELKPDAVTVHVPGAGHLIRFDRFSEFMDALEKFLQKIS